MLEPGLEGGLHWRGGAAVGVACGGNQRRLEPRQLFWHDGVSHSPAAGAERTEYSRGCSIQYVSSKPGKLGEPCGDDGALWVHLSHAHMVTSEVEAGVDLVREHDDAVPSTYGDQCVQLLS